MIHGVDTGFLVAAEVLEHAQHAAARDTLKRLLTAGDFFAVAPQVLAEFIHVVTDPRRFNSRSTLRKRIGLPSSGGPHGR